MGKGGRGWGWSVEVWMMDWVLLFWVGLNMGRDVNTPNFDLCPTNEGHGIISRSSKKVTHTRGRTTSTKNQTSAMLKYELSICFGRDLSKYTKTRRSELLNCQLLW